MLDEVADDLRQIEIMMAESDDDIRPLDSKPEHVRKTPSAEDAELPGTITSKMYTLSEGDVAFGPHSRMSVSSKERSREVRGELWDHFERFSLLRGATATPESLSSAPGCLPSIFADDSSALAESQNLVEVSCR